MASGAGQERAEIEALADHASESRDGAGTDVVQVFSFFPAGPAAALPVTVQPGIREPPVLAWCQPPSHLEAAAAATTPAIAAAAADTAAAAADDNAAFDDTPSAEDTSPHPNTVDTAASADTAASDCPPQPAGKLAARRRYDDFGAPRYELHLAVNRLRAHEPDLYDAIHKLCQHRPDYPVEIAARTFCYSIEGTANRQWHNVRKLCVRDHARKAGVGPKPWKTQRLFRNLCGRTFGGGAAVCALPVARGCSALCHTIGGCGHRCHTRDWSQVLGGVFVMLSVFALLIDAADIVVDLVYVARLADEGHTGYAALLACAVAIVVPLEAFLKHMLYHHATRVGIVTAVDQQEKILFLLCLALSELLIFMVEDASTILIWFLTGTFDFSDAAYANLYLTVGSGCVAAFGVGYPMVSALFFEKDGCLRALPKELRKYRDVRHRIRDNRERATPHMRNLYSQNIKSRATFHYGVIYFVYGMLMWMATEGLIVFWSWVAIDKIAENRTVDDVDDSIYRGVLAAYILGWIVSISGLYLFFVSLERGNVPPVWHPLFDFCVKHFGGCLKGRCACGESSLD